ncbi:MAG: hypothetical protein ACR2PG_07115, partial [Hyphomicrobiaceae bacterium]
MQTSIYIAKLMGPVIGVAGLGYLLNRSAFQAMLDEFVENTGIIVMSGLISLVVGLAIVDAHNLW